MKKPQPFEKPIHITRPTLPEFTQYSLALEQVWENRRLTNDGPVVQNLEKRLCEFLESRFCTLFTNGTLALMVAYKALGLTGNVITTPFTFPATLHALTWIGISPIFCDIKPDDFTLNPALLPELITPNTTGIVPVHIFNNLSDFVQIERVAKEHNLQIVYDAAHAFGAKFNGESIANHGNITMYSFHATKVFHTIEGGLLAYNSDQLDQVLRLFRNFGIYDAETVQLPGINAKLNEFQAIMGLLLLDSYEADREVRIGLFNTYKTRLAPRSGVRVIQIAAGIESNFAHCVIQIDPAISGISRDELHETLMTYNLFTRKYFFPLCSWFDHYKNLPSASPDRLPVAEKAAREVLMLPLYSGLGFDDVHKICDILDHVVKNKH